MFDVIFSIQIIFWIHFYGELSIAIKCLQEWVLLEAFEDFLQVLNICQIAKTTWHTSREVVLIDLQSVEICQLS